ncbi:MAG: tetratricopeptide repeat protein [Spirochaetales bacterium]|nr:tetratricopeptide repeat protein [Spirochaetales bacterium]
MKYIYAALVIILLASCSTAPKKSDEVVDTKNQAAELIDYGNRAFEDAQYDQALKFFNMALDQNVTVDNEPGIAGSYNSIGKVYLRLGKIDRAMDYFEKALKIAQKINNPLIISQSSNNIGETWLFRNDTSMALEYFNTALTIPGSASQEVEVHIAVINNNIGIVQKRLGNYESALEYLTKSMKTNSKYKKFAELATNYYMIASVYSKQELYGPALENAQLALEMDKKVENSPNIAQDLFVIGIIYKKTGDETRAFDYFEKSYMIYERINLPREMKKVLVYMLEYLEKKGYAEQYREYKRIQDILEKM